LLPFPLPVPSPYGLIFTQILAAFRLTSPCFSDLHPFETLPPFLLPIPPSYLPPSPPSHPTPLPSPTLFLHLKQDMRPRPSEPSNWEVFQQFASTLLDFIKIQISGFCPLGPVEQTPFFIAESPPPRFASPFAFTLERFRGTFPQGDVHFILAPNICYSRLGTLRLPFLPARFWPTPRVYG